MDRNATDKLSLRTRTLTEPDDYVHRREIARVLEQVREAAGAEPDRARPSRSQYQGTGRPITAPVASRHRIAPSSVRTVDGFEAVASSELTETLHELTGQLFHREFAISVDYEPESDRPARLALSYDEPVQLTNPGPGVYAVNGDGELVAATAGMTTRRVVVLSDETDATPSFTEFECVAEDGEVTWRPLTDE